MKDTILAILAILAAIYVLNYKGNSQTDNNLSPELSVQSQIDSIVNLSRSQTTVEHQEIIEHQTNIGQQIVVTGVVPTNVTTRLIDTLINPNGRTVVEGSANGCQLIPGDEPYNYGGNGECFVINNGQRFFVAPTGVRNYLGSVSDPVPTPLPIVQPTPLPAYNRSNMTTEQLISEYERITGKSIPLFFRYRSDDLQRSWLLTQLIGR